jgi:hypothetical protein
MAGDAHRERKHRGRIISIDGDGAGAWNPALAGRGSCCGVHGRCEWSSSRLGLRDAVFGGCGDRDSWHQRGSGRCKFAALERKRRARFLAPETKRRTRGERDGAGARGRDSW